MRVWSSATIPRSMGCACLCLAVWSGSLGSVRSGAQESTLSIQPRMQTKPCVLLKNDNVLFGRARQVGEYIYVSTGPGDELKLPREQVACWADSLVDLYRYRIDHRTDTNLQAHLVDALWCIQNELFDQAANEIDFAKAIAPRHREVRKLQDLLQRRQTPVMDSSAAAPSATTPLLQTAFSSEAPPSAPIDARTLAGFATRVQPTLINRCGRCHKQDSPLQWRLHVPTSGTRLTARLTRENLRETLPFVNHGEPHASPLLQKATSPHGGIDAPLNVRNTAAVDALRQWLSAANITLPDRRRDSADQPNQDLGATSQGGLNRGESDIAQVAYDRPIDTGGASVQTPGLKSAGSTRPIDPQRLPTVANPFDASLFNRKYHRDAP